MEGRDADPKSASRVLSWVPALRAAIIDLDGTLYDGSGWLEAYYRELAADGDVPASGLRAEVESILQGEHPVRLGSFYDSRSDTVLHHRDWRYGRATTWEGQEARYTRAPGEPIAYDAALVYVGDAWQAVNAVAMHQGIPEERRRAAFLAVRQAINDPGHELGASERLDELLGAFDHCELRILATNTPEHAARGLVDKLGVHDRFHAVVFGIRKPAGVLPLLEDVRSRTGAACHEIVCIGDNYWNDLLPGLRSGCRTVWVRQHESAPALPCDLIVRRLVDLLDHLPEPVRRRR